MQWRKQTKLVAGIMTMLCATAFIGCGTNSAKADSVVMQVDAQEITKEEYQMILSKYVARVKANYSTKEANSDTFWESEFENGTPLTEIMALTREELVYNKTLAKLAKEQGSDIGTSYREIAKSLEEENQNRNDKKNQNQVVYGLLSYEMTDYYDYIYSGLENEVMEKIKTDCDVSEEEIENYYNENVDKYRCNVMVDTMVAELRKDQGVELAYEAAKAMQHENTEAALETLLPDVNFYSLSMSDLNTEEGKSGAYLNRWIMASSMQAGEICEPFAIGENIMVIHCIEREEGIVLDLAAVRDEIKNQLEMRKATEILKNEVQKVNVVYDEKNLVQIAMETLQK